MVNRNKLTLNCIVVSIIRILITRKQIALVEYYSGHRNRSARATTAVITFICAIKLTIKILKLAKNANEVRLNITKRGYSAK